MLGIISTCTNKVASSQILFAGTDYRTGGFGMYLTSSSPNLRSSFRNFYQSHAAMKLVAGSTHGHDLGTSFALANASLKCPSGTSYPQELNLSFRLTLDANKFLINLDDGFARTSRARVASLAPYWTRHFFESSRHTF